MEGTALVWTYQQSYSEMCQVIKAVQYTCMNMSAVDLLKWFYFTVINSPETEAMANQQLFKFLIMWIIELLAITTLWTRAPLWIVSRGVEWCGRRASRLLRTLQCSFFNPAYFKAKSPSAQLKERSHKIKPKQFFPSWVKVSGLRSQVPDESTLTPEHAYVMDYINVTADQALTALRTCFTQMQEFDNRCGSFWFD